MRRLVLLLASSTWLGSAVPAEAAGVSLVLPKFRTFDVEGAHSYGFSAQVVGTTVKVAMTELTLALDTALTRDFGQGANYAFLDLTAGVGVPLAITPQFYATPGLDAHGLAIAASPQGLSPFVFGAGPKLAFGYKASNTLAFELGGSYGFLFGLKAGSTPINGFMSAYELTGRYNF